MANIQVADDRGLAGRRIFLTGAGSGIGRGIAEALAAAGANLSLFDLSGAAIESLAAELRPKGVKICCHVGDVTDQASVQAAVDAAVKYHGGLDGGVNNAGILGENAELLDYSGDVFRRVIDVNLMGVVNCMKAELGVMTQGGRGSIVNMASAAGWIGWAGYSAYVASKHAVVGLTKAAGLEYASRGIRVNSVCPAFIHSEITREIFKAENAYELAVSAHPIGRIGNPQEVAEAVMWLLSDRSSFSVGSNLLLDGGMVAA